MQRFLPSEFGMDPARMANALEPGRVTFDEKMVVRKAIEDANIPFTYVSANCFAGYFVPNLSQLGTLLPPKNKVCLYGDGSAKGIYVITFYREHVLSKHTSYISWALVVTNLHLHMKSEQLIIIYTVVYMDEDDIATYTIKSIDDPRTLNKTLYIRPKENILTQMQLIEKWERLSGKKLEKLNISAEDFLASMEGENQKAIPVIHFIRRLWIFSKMTYKYAGMDYASKVGVGHFYHIFYEGCLTNFEIREDGSVEASQLYPEVDYTRMDSYLNQFLWAVIPYFLPMH